MVFVRSDVTACDNGGRGGRRGAASLPAGKPHRRVSLGGDHRHVFRRLFRDPAAVADADSATPEYDRAWGELPEYREDANYIYKTYNTTLISTKYNEGGYRRNFTVCFDRDLRVAALGGLSAAWVLYAAERRTHR